MAFALPGAGHAQDAGGGFEQIPADQSPLSFRTTLPISDVFLRQYRDNSTVFVGRWSVPVASGLLTTTTDDLFLETVFSTSAPGFTFGSQIPPSRLLGMFDALGDTARVNGPDFTQDTKYGQIAATPFMREGAQCMSFLGEWNPPTPQDRGSRLLGYYCNPQIKTANADTRAPQQISMIDAQSFAAGVFSRLDIQLPDGSALSTAPIGTETTPATANANATGTDIAPSGARSGGTPGTATAEGMAISFNWQGDRGEGMMKFDQPGGQGSMIIDSPQRHCEGIWHHEGGSYQTTPLPFGSWYVFCNNGSSARGRYTSEDPQSVSGEGKDDQGQAVYFRQIAR